MFYYPRLAYFAIRAVLERPRVGRILLTPLFAGTTGSLIVRTLDTHAYSARWIVLLLIVQLILFMILLRRTFKDGLAVGAVGTHGAILTSFKTQVDLARIDPTTAAWFRDECVTAGTVLVYFTKYDARLRSLIAERQEIRERLQRRASPPDVETIPEP